MGRFERLLGRFARFKRLQKSGLFSFDSGGHTPKYAEVFVETTIQHDPAYATRMATVTIKAIKFKLPTILCKLLFIASARCGNCEVNGGSHYDGACVGL